MCWDWSGDSFGEIRIPNLTKKNNYSISLKRLKKKTAVQNKPLSLPWLEQWQWEDAAQHIPGWTSLCSQITSSWVKSLKVGIAMLVLIECGKKQTVHQQNKQFVSYSWHQKQKELQYLILLVCLDFCVILVTQLCKTLCAHIIRNWNPIKDHVKWCPCPVFSFSVTFGLTLFHILFKKF